MLLTGSSSTSSAPKIETSPPPPPLPPTTNAVDASEEQLRQRWETDNTAVDGFGWSSIGKSDDESEWKESGRQASKQMRTAAVAAAAIESSATWVVWIFYSERTIDERANERHPSLRGPFVEEEDYRPIIWISDLGRQTPNSEFAAADDTEPKSPFLSRDCSFWWWWSSSSYDNKFDSEVRRAERTKSTLSWSGGDDEEENGVGIMTSAANEVISHRVRQTDRFRSASRRGNSAIERAIGKRVSELANSF